MHPSSTRQHEGTLGGSRELEQTSGWRAAQCVDRHTSAVTILGERWWSLARGARVSRASEHHRKVLCGSASAVEQPARRGEIAGRGARSLEGRYGPSPSPAAQQLSEGKP